MITKDMIKAGFESGRISIENEYAGCMSLCCRVGDNAFYFAGNEFDNMTAKEYKESHTADEIVDVVYDVLKDSDTAEANGLDDTEYFIYETILRGQTV